MATLINFLSYNFIKKFLIYELLNLTNFLLMTMNSKTKQTLKDVIISTLSYLHKLEEGFSETEQYFVFNKTHKESWNGAIHCQRWKTLRYEQEIT